MAYRSRQARISSVGGVFGLKVEIVGDLKTVQALAQLPTAIQRKVARLAIAAKARPIAASMKSGAKLASASSRRHEGVGATARSIATKVATSKKRPWVTYAVIGARRGYYEFVHLKRDQQRSGVSHILTTTRRRRRRGVYEDRGGRVKALGAAARKARLSPNRNKDGTHGGAIKRGPAKYLHLIEKGFNHRMGGRARAYRFMSHAASVGKSAGHAAYLRVMDEGIRREFGKMAAK